MASKLTKLLRSIAVFIFLSAPASAAEATRCYWCGPLAEQVHRSQRAPSCSIFDLEQHDTVCDKGYTHCAIVVTSPPYAESRLCVKFYQDECYSLYCNSTKTWRMVCACRGDLCNGPSTDREIKAFATVPKFPGKTNARNKRSLKSSFISVKTKSPSDNNTIIIINNKSEYTDMENLQNDQPIEQNENTTNAYTAMDDMPKRIEENIIIEHGTFKNAESVTHASHEAETADSEMDVPTMAAPENQLDNAKIDEATHVVDVEYTTTADIVKETHGSDTVTSLKPTSVETQVTVVSSVTPGKLPPAEALQQNVTPTKAIELTTMATVAMTTNNHVIETTTLHSAKRNLTDKNRGTQNVARLIIFVITFLLHSFL